MVRVALNPVTSVLIRERRGRVGDRDTEEAHSEKAM